MASGSHWVSLSKRDLIVTHFLQQGHIYLNKAIPPKSATPLGGPCSFKPPHSPGVNRLGLRNLTRRNRKLQGLVESLEICRIQMLLVEGTQVGSEWRRYHSATSLNRLEEPCRLRDVERCHCKPSTLLVPCLSKVQVSYPQNFTAACLWTTIVLWQHSRGTSLASWHEGQNL